MQHRRRRCRRAGEEVVSSSGAVAGSCWVDAPSVAPLKIIFGGKGKVDVVARKNLSGLWLLSREGWCLRGQSPGVVVWQADSVGARCDGWRCRTIQL